MKKIRWRSGKDIVRKGRSESGAEGKVREWRKKGEVEKKKMREWRRKVKGIEKGR